MSKKLLLHTIAASLLFSTAAIAQTTAPPTTPAEGAPPPAASAPAESSKASLTLTDVEAKNWIDKSVYGSDGKSIGEVGAIQRDVSGQVTELHADIGGFLGIGETRVKVMPDQFKLSGDRVVLTMTADQAKSLPKIVKAK